MFKNLCWLGLGSAAIIMAAGSHLAITDQNDHGGLISFGLFFFVIFLIGLIDASWKKEKEPHRRRSPYDSSNF